MAYGAGVICVSNAGSSNSYVARSTDGGRNYSLIFAVGPLEHKGIATDGQGTWIISCGNNSQSGSMLRSVDHGQTWVDIGAPAGSQFYYGIGYSNGWFFVSIFNSSSYRSRDGRTWESCGLTGTPGRGFAGNDNGVVLSFGEDSSNVYRSTRDGIAGSWEIVTVVATSVKPCYGNGVFVMFAYGSQTLYSSRDQGRSWASYTLPISGGWGNCVYLAACKLWVILESNGIKYLVSRTGYDDWRVPPNSFPSSTYHHGVDVGGSYAGIGFSNTYTFVGTL
jgi:hypothetical protein